MWVLLPLHYSAPCGGVAAGDPGASSPRWLFGQRFCLRIPPAETVWNGVQFPCVCVPIFVVTVLNKAHPLEVAR